MENAILGALGVATKDIPANAIAGGIPAKQIKSKDDVQSEGWEESDQGGGDTGHDPGQDPDNDQQAQQEHQQQDRSHDLQQ